MKINPKILRKYTVYSLFCFAERLFTWKNNLTRQAFHVKSLEPPNAAPTKGRCKIGNQRNVATVRYHPLRVLQKVPTSTLRKTCLTWSNKSYPDADLLKVGPKTLTSWKHELLKQLKTLKSLGTESLLKVFRNVGRNALNLTVLWLIFTWERMPESWLKKLVDANTCFFCRFRGLVLLHTTSFRKWRKKRHSMCGSWAWISSKNGHF